MAEVETLNKAMIKYLPVEGKPKEGDDVDDVKGILRVHKPFVITQDIEVGDEVCIFDCDNYNENYQPSEFPVKAICFKITDYPTWWFKCEDKEFELYFHQFGKILGEVSSEATFVEDGKEYEVIVGWDGWVKPYWKEGDNEFEPVVVKIKCPTCKSYH